MSKAKVYDPKAPVESYDEFFKCRIPTGVLEVARMNHVFLDRYGSAGIDRWRDETGWWLVEARSGGIRIQLNETCQRANTLPSPLSAYEARRQLLCEREKTRWRVVVRDCRENTAVSADGTPCLDTYTKAGFNSLRAAEEWMDSHPCSACLVIVDAHVELPWGTALFEESARRMEEERVRLHVFARQRRERRSCETCGVTGAVNLSVSRRAIETWRGGAAVLCDGCASGVAAIPGDDHPALDRFILHENRLGYEGDLPPEIREYYENEEEWLRRFETPTGKDDTG